MLAGVLLAGGLAGCMSPIGSEQSGSRQSGADVKPARSAASNLLTFDEYVTEFRAAVASLTWPKGVAEPTRSPEDDKAGSFQEGVGEGDATAYWKCAWMNEYLTYRDRDPERSGAALDTYATIATLPAWQRSYGDPGMRALILSDIEKARLGDASGMQQSYRANCPIGRK